MQLLKQIRKAARGKVPVVAKPKAPAKAFNPIVIPLGK
jgi:hypothetical protein